MELVGLNPDIILATGPEAIQAVKNATKTIPIVMVFSGDPVEGGIVASLARPSGNITGTARAFVSSAATAAPSARLAEP